MEREERGGGFNKEDGRGVSHGSNLMLFILGEEWRTKTLSACIPLILLPSVEPIELLQDPVSLFLSLGAIFRLSQLSYGWLATLRTDLYLLSLVDV